MTFLDLPLAFCPRTLECTRTVHVLEDIAFLYFIKPKEHQDAKRKEHDLRRVVALRQQRRSWLARWRCAGRHRRKREVEVLRHECGRLCGLHGSPAVARLALDLAVLWLAADGGWRVARDVPVVAPEPVLGRAARDEVRARVAVLLRLRHAREAARVRRRGHRGAHFGRGAVAGEQREVVHLVVTIQDQKQKGCSCTYNIESLVERAWHDVVLALEEVRKQLHSEAIREPVGGDAAAARSAALCLGHAFCGALVLAHHARVCLVAMDRVVLTSFCGERTGLWV